MKCDELEAYGMNDPAIGDEYEMYKVSDVDAAIAELKAIVTTDNSAVIARLEAENAELKKACNDKDGWCRHTLKENRHHKYKRCLANADAAMHKRWRNDEGFDYARSTRHMNKWIELADKFKEAK